MKRAEKAEEREQKRQARAAENEANGKEAGTSETGATAEGDNSSDTSKKRWLPALKVLRDIRPGIRVAEKKVHGLPEDTFAASCVIDGKEYQGRGATLVLAKSNAAELVLRLKFGLNLDRTQSE